MNELFADTINLSKITDKSKIKKYLYDSYIKTNRNMVLYLRELHINSQAIFIGFNTPSMKNSREIKTFNTKLSVCHKKELYKEKGIWFCSECHQPAQRLTRNFLDYSNTVKNYFKATEEYWLTNKKTWQSIVINQIYPLDIGLYFIRDSRRVFDYINAAQIVCDLMQKYNWIPEDDALHIKPDFLGFHYAPETAGVIITLMNSELVSMKYNIKKIKGVKEYDKAR